MRLEIIVSKAQYAYYRVALVEVKPSWPEHRKLIIGFHSKHLRVLECRRCSKVMIPAHREELQQIKAALEVKGLQTTFFHQRLGFRFSSLVTQPVPKKAYWLDQADGRSQYIVGYKELKR